MPLLLHLEDHITIGEPILQVIINWATTTGTTSYQREPQKTNLCGLKSK